MSVMKKCIFFLGCTLVLTILWCNPVSAQLFAPHIDFEATLSDSSMFIGIGETSLSGTLLGYDASTIFEEWAKNTSE